MIDGLLCDHNKTLLEAYRLLNSNHKEIVIVVDDEHRLRGVLTDGDIRRLLLDGHELHETIDTLTLSQCTFARPEDTKEDVLHRANALVKVVPIVDRSGKVVDFMEIRTNQWFPVASPDLLQREFSYLADAFLSGWISSSGRYIGQFESLFKEYIGCEFGVAVASGTAALHLALLALDIGEGDEVIVPDLTFAAAINVVLHAGATPVIVDIDPQTWNIDPQEVRKAITPRTKALIAVHLYGQPCEMSSLLEICHSAGIHLVEDCAEAHGAEYRRQKVGSFGIISCFSFFANKIITTGEGGMCLTNHEALDGKMRILKDHGMSRSRKYYHEVVGYNYRMTNMQAAIGCAQIGRIDAILEARASVEELYRRVLGELSSLEFQRNNIDACSKVTWLVCALWRDASLSRDELLDVLRGDHVDARPFFTPLSQMPIYQKYVLSCRNSREIAKMGICFPTHNVIAQEKIEWLKTKISLPVTESLPR